MKFVTLSQAKSSLSRLVEAIEQGQEREIVITRNGCLVAKLVPMESARVGWRIGAAKGVFEVPESIDAHNDEVARMFTDGKPP